MSVGDVVTLMQGGILEVLTVAFPVLIVALIVGLIIAILQAVTSIQEQTLTFVPKILAILLVLALGGAYFFSSLEGYTTRLFEQIGSM